MRSVNHILRRYVRRMQRSTILGWFHDAAETCNDWPVHEAPQRTLWCAAAGADRLRDGGCETHSGRGSRAAASAIYASNSVVHDREQCSDRGSHDCGRDTAWSDQVGQYSAAWSGCDGLQYADGQENCHDDGYHGHMVDDHSTEWPV